MRGGRRNGQERERGVVTGVVLWVDGQDVVGGEDQSEQSILRLASADGAGVSQHEASPSVQSVDSILAELAGGEWESNERWTGGKEMDLGGVLRGLEEEEE